MSLSNHKSQVLHYLSVDRFRWSTWRQCPCPIPHLPHPPPTAPQPLPPLSLPNIILTPLHPLCHPTLYATPPLPTHSTLANISISTFVFMLSRSLVIDHCFLYVLPMNQGPVILFFQI